MTLDQLNQKRKSLTRNTLVLGAIAALLISQLTWWILQGVLGIAALGVAGFLGLAIINAAPVVAMKFSNWKLKAIKAEAFRNPIETLQNEYNLQIQQKNVVRKRISDFNTQVKNFEDKVEDFKASFPKDAAKFQEQLENMKRLLARREAKYQDLCKGLELFEQEIQRADALWKMSQAAQQLNAAAGQDDMDLMSKIKTETAIDSVQESLNRAFSEMETELLDAEPPQLTQSAPITLEATVVSSSKVSA